MKSKTKINKQAERKTNPEIVETIIVAKKNKEWLIVANELSKPRKLRVEINLTKINESAKEGKIIVVPGKVLSQGNISEKVNLVALQISERAKEKILNAKGTFKTILEEIKSNPSAKGLKILK